MVESVLQKIRNTSNYTLLESVTVFGAYVMDKYYEMQFRNKEQSIRIPDKPNMEEYIERLETIVKRCGVKKSFFKYH